MPARARKEPPKRLRRSRRSRRRKPAKAPSATAPDAHGIVQDERAQMQPADKKRALSDH
jgi:hypothetical protein